MIILRNTGLVFDHVGLSFIDDLFTLDGLKCFNSFI